MAGQGLPGLPLPPSHFLNHPATWLFNCLPSAVGRRLCCWDASAAEQVVAGRGGAQTGEAGRAAGMSYLAAVEEGPAGKRAGQPFLPAPPMPSRLSVLWLIRGGRKRPPQPVGWGAGGAWRPLPPTWRQLVGGGAALTRSVGLPRRLRSARPPLTRPGLAQAAPRLLLASPPPPPGEPISCLDTRGAVRLEGRRGGSNVNDRGGGARGGTSNGPAHARGGAVASASWYASCVAPVFPQRFPSLRVDRWRRHLDVACGPFT